MTGFEHSTVTADTHARRDMGAPWGRVPPGSPQRRHRAAPAVPPTGDGLVWDHDDGAPDPPAAAAEGDDTPSTEAAHPGRFDVSRVDSEADRLVGAAAAATYPQSFTPPRSSGKLCLPHRPGVRGGTGGTRGASTQAASGPRSSRTSPAVGACSTVTTRLPARYRRVQDPGCGRSHDGTVGSNPPLAGTALRLCPPLGRVNRRAPRSRGGPGHRPLEPRPAVGGRPVTAARWCTCGAQAVAVGVDHGDTDGAPWWIPRDPPAHVWACVDCLEAWPWDEVIAGKDVKEAA